MYETLLLSIRVVGVSINQSGDIVLPHCGGNSTVKTVLGVARTRKYSLFWEMVLRCRSRSSVKKNVPVLGIT